MVAETLYIYISLLWSLKIIFTSWGWFPVELHTDNQVRLKSVSVVRIFKHATSSPNIKN